MKKIYLLFISLLMVALVNAQDKKVIVISEALPADNTVIKKIVDNLDTIPGIAITHKAMSDIKTITYTEYDAVVITENGGSSGMVEYNNLGWPLPTVCMKAYILGRKDSKCFLFKQGPNNWKISTKGAELQEGANQLVVLDNSDILKIYKKDDVVTWTTGTNDGSSDAHIQSFDLQYTVTDSVNPKVKAASTKLGNAKVFVDDASVPANLKCNFWKIEKNDSTERIVAWGIHHNYMEKATEDFWKILGRSLKWVLKMPLDPVSVNNASVAEFNVYPNPVVNVLNISNASSVSNVAILDMSGRVIINTSNNRECLMQINTSALVKGVYMCQVTTVDGQVFSSKLIK